MVKFKGLLLRRINKFDYQRGGEAGDQLKSGKDDSSYMIFVPPNSRDIINQQHFNKTTLPSIQDLLRHRSSMIHGFTQMTKVKRQRHKASSPFRVMYERLRFTSFCGSKLSRI